MDFRKLEVCVDNIESAAIAEYGGADRIELCQALEVGGMTPSAGLVKVAKQKLNIPVFMMIRPRAGSFVFTESELHLMLEDISTGLSLGVDGFVTGAISVGKVDKKYCSQLISAARGRPVTFHRAFDFISDDNALEDIIDLGFSRILTSGGAQTAIQGKKKIKSLIEQAGSRIIIMPGSCIRENNLSELVSYTQAFEYHSAALARGQLTPGNPILKGVNFCAFVNPTVVQDMKRILKFGF